MTSDDFRRMALALPEAVEGAHQDHPDFRVKGRIFATLFSRDGVAYGMLKLKPDQQRELVRDDPDVWAPCAGAWGRGGATQVQLAGVNKKMLRQVRDALLTAWCNVAPKRLVNNLGDG